MIGLYGGRGGGGGSDDDPSLDAPPAPDRQIPPQPAEFLTASSLTFHPPFLPHLFFLLPSLTRCRRRKKNEE